MAARPWCLSAPHCTLDFCSRLFRVHHHHTWEVRTKAARASDEFGRQRRSSKTLREADKENQQREARVLVTAVGGRLIKNEHTGNNGVREKIRSLITAMTLDSNKAVEVLKVLSRREEVIGPERQTSFQFDMAASAVFIAGGLDGDTHMRVRRPTDR